MSTTSASSSKPTVASLKAENAVLQARITELEAQLASSKPAKKERALRDPNAPRMISSRNVFYAKKRDEVKAANPDAKGMLEQNKILSEMWAALTEEQQAEYPPEPAAPKPVKEPREKKEKKVRDPDAPKKPVKGFMLFSQQKRPEIVAANPEMKFGEIGAQLGKLWKALSDEEKAAFKA